MSVTPRDAERLVRDILVNVLPKDVLDRPIQSSSGDQEGIAALARRSIQGMSEHALRAVAERIVETVITYRYGSDAHSASHNSACSSALAGFRELPSRNVSPSPVEHLYHIASGSVQSEDHIVLPVMTTTDAIRTADDAGFKILNQYVLRETLGKGTGGKVKLAFDTERNTTVAIKIVLRKRVRSAEQQQQLQREVGVMKRLRHKNLVSLYEVIDDPESDRLYLVMQYVDDGPLVTVDPDTLTCTPMDAAQVAALARQLTAGLAYLHSHRIVHRDIKPENILKSRDGTVYLADFGLSEEFDGDTDKVSGWEGSPLFMAPEVHALRGSSDVESVDGYAADVYSLGVTLYLLLTGRLPFATPIGGTHADVPWAPLPHAWQSLLSAMMHADPTQRPRVSEVRRAMKAAAPLLPRVPTRPEPNVLRRLRTLSDDNIAAMLPRALREHVSPTPPAPSRGVNDRRGLVPIPPTTPRGGLPSSPLSGRCVRRFPSDVRRHLYSP